MSRTSRHEGLLAGRVMSATLDNGLRVFAMHRTEAPVVSVQAWMLTGSVHEGRHLGCGLSHFLEHMLFQGSSRHPGSSGVDAIHRMGGDMNAYTSHNCTVYYANVSSKGTPLAVDVLSDMVMSPKLPNAKFKFEKGAILRERDMNLDRPERVIAEKLWLEMFLEHPVRHPVIGYREKLETVDREMLLEYHARRYSPARCLFVIVGDIEPEMAEALVREKASAWQMGRIDDDALPLEPAQFCARRLNATFRDPLSRLAIGWKIPDSSSPDMPAIDMLMSALGSSGSSRLYKTLKTELELAISVSSFNYAPTFQGAAGLVAACQSAKLAKLSNAALDIVKDARDGAIDAHELRRHVNQMSADYLRGMRSNSGLARLVGGSVMTYGSVDFADRYIERLKSLTTDDLADVAGRYFTETAMTHIELVPEEARKQEARHHTSSKVRHSPPAMRVASGGQRMIHYRDTSLPLIDVCAVLPGGLIWEPESIAGVSKMLAASMMSGAGPFSETALAEFLDNEAMELSLASGNNTFILRMNCRREVLGSAMKVMKALLAHPHFPERQFERERRNILDCLKSRRMTPQSVAEDAFCQSLYGTHPYSMPCGGSEDALRKLGREDMSDFLFNNCMIASKAVFGIAGDIESAEAFDTVSDLVEHCKWTPAAALPLPDTPHFPRKPVRKEIVLDKEQAVLMCGMPSCNGQSPDRPALDLLHAATNSQSSRLFKTVRDDAGLAYYTGLVYSSGLHDGYLAYYAGTSKATAGKVEALLERERSRLAKDGLSKAEFEAAKACVLHDLSEDLQNPGRLILNSSVAEFYSVGFDAPWLKADIISGLSLNAANRVFSKYLSSHSRVSVIVSP